MAKKLTYIKDLSDLYAILTYVENETGDNCVSGEIFVDGSGCIKWGLGDYEVSFKDHWVDMSAIDKVIKENNDD